MLSNRVGPLYQLAGHSRVTWILRKLPGLRFNQIVSCDGLADSRDDFGDRTKALGVLVIGLWKHEQRATREQYVERKAEIFSIAHGLVIANAMAPNMRGADKRLQ